MRTSVSAQRVPLPRVLATVLLSWTLLLLQASPQPILSSSSKYDASTSDKYILRHLADNRKDAGNTNNNNNNGNNNNRVSALLHHRSAWAKLGDDPRVPLLLQRAAMSEDKTRRQTPGQRLSAVDAILNDDGYLPATSGDGHFFKRQMGGAIRACGSPLLLILENTCLTAEDYDSKRSLTEEDESSNYISDQSDWEGNSKGSASSASLSSSKPSKRNHNDLVQACCYKACSMSTLLTYCHPFFD
ncbi:unnamed protein product [Notodromas monacha]|uniref:Insulin-like domain-containing protein n=1 Tax=Notodromas monacha TaxID=399045 RepID=A0A7R9BQ82_9CRUS|nr:unnamed protein product [Notodromas monacha]CAG0918148.1 unnamed protein product [Notodromas monacha]